MIERWIRLWDRREAPTSLALIRILAGAVMLADLLTARALGLVPDVWAPPPHGLGFGAVGRYPPAAVRWLGASAETSELVWWVAALAAAMLCAGAFTRVSGLVHALASAQLAAMAPDADRGIDTLLRVVSVLLALSGAGARFSVDAALRRAFGRPPPDRVPAWPRYLIFLQVLWVYASAVQHRSSSGWWPWGSFSALAVIASDPHYARLEPGWVGRFFPLTQLATATTMLFESTAPLLVLWTFFDRTPGYAGRLRRVANFLKLRWVWLGTGVVFHLGIAFVLRLGIFPFGVLALYPAFLHPTELEAFWRWLRRPRTGTSGSSSRAP